MPNNNNHFNNVNLSKPSGNNSPRINHGIPPANRINVRNNTWKNKNRVMVGSAYANAIRKNNAPWRPPTMKNKIKGFFGRMKPTKVTPINHVPPAKTTRTMRNRVMGIFVKEKPNNNTQRAFKIEMAGKKIAELMLALDMKRAVRKGTSFSDFLREFSPPNINKNGVRGKFSSRIYKGSNIYKMWLEQGGRFTPEEVSKILVPSGTMSTPKFYTSWLNRKMVSEQRLNKLQNNASRI